MKKRLWSSAVVAIALMLGAYHLRLAMRALFVFREGEPLASWIAVLTGAASTMPAAILSIFKKKAAGMWLMATAVVSAVATVLSEPSDTRGIVAVVGVVTLPMIVLGLMLVIIAGARESTRSR